MNFQSDYALAIYTYALPDAQKAAVSPLAEQLFQDVPKFGPNAQNLRNNFWKLLRIQKMLVGPPGFEPGTNGL
jgi:hypothetical protein